MAKTLVRLGVLACAALSACSSSSSGPAGTTADASKVGDGDSLHDAHASRDGVAELPDGSAHDAISTVDSGRQLPEGGGTDATRSSDGAKEADAHLPLDGSADGAEPYGPPALGLTASDLSFEDTFETLSRAADMSKRWQSQYWFYGTGARADLSDTVYLDETVTLSDGTTRNPFVASTGGLLDVVAASLGTVTAPTYTTKLYYAGCLTTLPSFHQDWGYYEVTLKMPPSPGAWGAFYLYPFTDYPSASSTSGEMDFFESTGAQPTYLNTTTHDYTNAVNHGTYSNVGVDFTAAFTTLGFDFEPTGLTRYVNNAKYDATPIPVPTDWVGKSWYVVLSHDVDRSTSPFWPGNSPSTGTYPKHFQVKAVRVFKTSATTVIGGSAALITL